MTPKELQEHLAILHLSYDEAAQLLGVATRTVRRWFEGEAVPGPVEQAFRAWRRLHHRNLPWRPDTVAINENDQQQIGAHREHAIVMSETLERVAARGGPRSPWYVDRVGCRAILGKMEVSFYRLPNGGFSLANYTRKDTYPDVERDQELIDDAVFCIAKEMKKEADIEVTLVYLDGSSFVGPDGKFGMMRHKEFPSNKLATDYVFGQMDEGSQFHGFAIREGKADTTGEFLWKEQELRAEYDRAARTRIRPRA
jgi:hypothetical protein